MKPNLKQLSSLVGNPLAYAIQKPDGVWVPIREPLTEKVLAEHLAWHKTAGTYVGHKSLVSGETISRTLVFDVDKPEGQLDEALEEVSALMLALHELGVPKVCVGREFSGKKGYHLWVPISTYVPNRDLRRLGRAVLTLAEVECEVFPKQDEVRDLGNLIKLPGGVHQVTGLPNNFDGPFPRMLSTAQLETILASLPEEKARSSTYVPGQGAFPCLDAIQEGVTEGGRNIALYHLAAMLRRGGLAEEFITDVLHQVNERGDPLEDRELMNVLSASRNGGPMCSKLPEKKRCPEGMCCLDKHQGLYTKARALRNAADGEEVVVRVAGRDPGPVLLVTHEDVKGVGRIPLKD